jgi:predicted AlkP superfamily pyrophosphatase or phosphodiesterase
MFRKFLVILAAASAIKSSAQQRPALVVGIVVDQMRNDVIYRYWDRFGPGGFRRLAERGYYFRNTQFNYLPTYTAPRHSSIYTGTTPRVHGIVGNEWFSLKDGVPVSCVFDASVSPVGTQADKGRMSPSKLLTNTFGDELELATVGRSRVFSVSLKDRSAVLPAGRAADGAFWFDALGSFVTSTWYMKELPAWLTAFNAQQLPKNYLSKGWTPLYAAETYSASLPDDSPYEDPLGHPKAAFPYNYQQSLDASRWSDLQYTPYGNTIIKDMALACVKGERLGKHPDTDVLCVSFSSTDILGHELGPRAMEMEDLYLRLDKDLEEFLSMLDREVGEGRYTVFLTADHGVSDVPAHLLASRLAGGYIYRAEIRRRLRETMQRQFGDSLIVSSVMNEQVYFNESRVTQRNIEFAKIEVVARATLLTMDGVAEVYSFNDLRNFSGAPDDIRTMLFNGYNVHRSGQLAYVVKPGYLDYGKRGTTHGSGYAYDTHVPLIFFGWGIPKGETTRRVEITQIAPTITELLHIARPGGSAAEPLNDFFK